MLAAMSLRSAATAVNFPLPIERGKYFLIFDWGGFARSGKTNRPEHPPRPIQVHFDLTAAQMISEPVEVPLLSLTVFQIGRQYRP